MLEGVNIHDILFLDIETIPQTATFDELDDTKKLLWDKKSSYLQNDDQDAEDVYKRAGIYAEFGKIICISVGVLTKYNESLGMRIKSYAGHDESALLKDFASMLKSYSAQKNIVLCAHNGKEFDFPYIARRMLVNGITLPQVLSYAGKKPWEVPHLDTMELWKFGDYKHYTSLDLLTNIFNIPSPKEDMDGSQVAKIYYESKNLERISAYCQNDVIAIIQLLLCYKGIGLIPEDRIEAVQQDDENK